MSDKRKESMKKLEKHTNTSKKDSFLMDFGKALTKYREELGISRNAAAKIIGISHTTLGAWEEAEGRLPNAWDMQKIADVYGIHVTDLFPGKAFTSPNSAVGLDVEGLEDINLEEFVFIPRYNVNAAAGDGSAISAENIMHHMAFRKYWVDNVIGAAVKDLVVIGVAGDSMEGEINNGDAILINTADKKLNNGIYVVRINGDLIVKRIQKLVGGVIRIISANPAYESFSIDANNLPSDFECIGRVVWHGRNVP